jgi:hypothetical protein
MTENLESQEVSENQQTQQPVEVESVLDTSAEKMTDAERAFLDKNVPLDSTQTTSESKQQDAASGMPKGYDKAIKALKLDGWDDEDVQALSPERVIALGKKATERHSAFGRKLQEAAGKKAEDLDEAKSGEEDDETAEAADEDDQSEEPGSAEPTGQPRNKDGRFSINYKALAKPVSDAIGLGSEVEEALASALESALAPIQEKLNEYDKYQTAIVEQRGEEIGQSIREKLSDRFPGLKDEEKFERVVGRMGLLAKSDPNYQSMEQLMLDAAKLELFDDNQEVSARKTTQVKRAQGQPTTTSRRTPTPAMSLEDKEDAVLDALMSGKGRDAARRAYFG